MVETFSETLPAPLQMMQRFLTFCGVYKLKYGMSQYLLWRVSQHLRKPLVHVGGNGPGIDHPNRFLGGFHNILVAVLAYPQRLLRNLVFGAVVSDRQHRRASSEFRDCRIGVEPARLTAFRNYLELGFR